MAFAVLKKEYDVSHYRHKKTYEELMGDEHLPLGYNKDTFTSYAYGKTVQGFKPYRAKRNPDGSLDVQTTGPFGFVLVTLDGREVWANLHKHKHGDSDHVTLLGWGNCAAYLGDFAPEEQAKLIAHRDTR